MADEEKLASADESGSPLEGSEHEAGIADDNQNLEVGETEISTSEEGNELDYKSLYEQTNTRLENLEGLFGRQAEELGELRKGKEKPAKDVSIDDYFDADSKKAISSLVESEVERRLRVEREQRENEDLRRQFNDLAGEYNISEENLQDLAIYASTKGVSLKKAADHLTKIGVMDKKNNSSNQQRQVADASKGPKGKSRVVGSGGKVARNYSDMSNDEFGKLSEEEQEAALRDVTAG